MDVHLEGAKPHNNSIRVFLDPAAVWGKAIKNVFQLLDMLGALIVAICLNHTQAFRKQWQSVFSKNQREEDQGEEDLTMTHFPVTQIILKDTSCYSNFFCMLNCLVAITFPSLGTMHVHLMTILPYALYNNYFFIFWKSVVTHSPEVGDNLSCGPDTQCKFTLHF